MRSERDRRALVTLVAVVAQLGCGGEAPAPDAAPEAGGTLHVGVLAPLEAPSPLLATQATTLQLLEHVLPPLGVVDERGSVQLRLARAFDDFGAGIDFRLRPVRWEDGAPVRARDFVLTADLLGDHRTHSPERARVEMVRAATALDDSTLRLEYLALYSGRVRDALLSPTPAHRVGDADDRADLGRWAIVRRPLACGPFRLLESSASRWVLARNPVSGWPACLDTVVVRSLPEEAAVRQFQRGALDVLIGMPPHRLDAVRRRRGARVVALVGRSYVFMGWNLRDGRFADAEVRRAAAQAVDVRRLIDALTHGQGDPARGPLVPAQDFTDTTAVFTYDPRAAARRLDAAGWRDRDGDGVRDRRGAKLAFHLLVPDHDVLRIGAAQRVARDLARVGMRAEVRVLTPESFLGRLSGHAFETFVGTWYPDLGLDLDAVWRSDSSDRLNFVGYASAIADSMLTRMRHERTDAERARLLAAFQAHVYADQPYLFLFQDPSFVALSPRVRGAEPSVLSPFQNLCEWWIPSRQRRGG